MELRIALDVDGTLNGYGGPVEKKLCHLLYTIEHKLFMLSKRDTREEDKKVADDFCLIVVQMSKGDTYVEIKSQTLKRLMQDYPGKWVYIGDRVEDMMVAWKCGAVYCAPEALSVHIGEELENPCIRGIL